ncbi:TIGR03749 family integrating conjugative element protein [Xanthomonas arboricola]|uniref:TIGR03749 family integrating conjugative element protein n=5 Tax=Xanthomonas arboricola pv. pruni TaxID=69929 RepID=A0AAQ0W9B4_9XANT|nr:TIGR03749 family integrating conjugative element protein [Xanthomonas arboricola]GAE53768.1 hypothetical protein XPR_0403 [Xanthomonas arboricola pv. pruni MAFF 301420]GAE58321.1 hypothetical protein XPN_0227 [Xanthomonas arboricola pv. pruni MAFF 301427]KCX01586.1 hypothetical protein DK27_07810 [Xanthomonas arboricola pv. pruni]KPN11922.1 hypothetical protein AN652_03235 [Xanthomonas arboricola pv. pruni]MDN0268210.1 TIGR03749 family integrating conjugative element protein [Xanthomonas ar
MKHQFAFWLSSVIAIAITPQAHAVQILTWERLPLAIPLVVDQERIVFVDRNVRIGVPTNVGERLRVQSAGGAVYLRANAPIEPTRLQLQDADTGALILLDITAQVGGEGVPPLEPVRIVDGPSTPTRYGEKPSEAEDADPDIKSLPAQNKRETPVAVVLTRYAAQNLYAPLRTVEAAPGVTRVNLRRNLPLETLLPTLPVKATALASWRLEDQWVTAVQLTNTSGTWIDLDPRTLQGDILTAAFQHPALGPHGQSEDTTVVYVVTRGRSLAQSLLPAIQRFDPAVNLPQPAVPAQGDGHAQ